jgi:hypothetical protein
MTPAPWTHDELILVHVEEAILTRYRNRKSS